MRIFRSVAHARLWHPHRWRVRLGLRWQIALLGTCGVLLVGGIYLVGLRIQSDFQRDADVSTRLKIVIDGFAQGFLRTYQTDTEFLLRRSEALIAQHDKGVEELSADIAAIDAILAALPADDPVQRAGVIRAGLNNYAIRFRNMVAAQRTVGFNENSGLEGNLREAVHQIESRLAKVDEPRLTVLMLMMRRHEKDFLLRGDEKYGDEIAERGKEFTAALEASAVAPGVRAEMKTLLARYQQSFNALMVGRGTLKDESDDLAQIFAGLAGVLAEVKGAVASRFDGAQAAVAATREKTTGAMILAILVAVIAAAALSAYVGRRITRPLGVLASAMERAAAGDHAVDVAPLARADEIGVISRAFAVFQQGMREMTRLAAEQQRMSADNQRLAAEQQARDERDSAERAAAAAREAAAGQAAIRAVLAEFQSAVGGIIDAVSAAASELEATAGTLASGADVTQRQSQVVASASEQASGNVLSVASATEEMAATAEEIGRQVQTSNRVSEEAVAQAAQTDGRIAALSQAASRIGDVVKLITAVAAQTNLLALNATIEAARAGEAGRGFAVVAQEVKALAGQTARATEEITTQISSMQSATAESVAAIKGIGATIGQVSQIAAVAAAAIEQQKSTTRSIARNIDDAARGTAEVASSIAEVNRRATETGAVSARMLAAAQSLSGQASHLKGEVERFMHRIHSGFDAQETDAAA